MYFINDLVAIQAALEEMGLKEKRNSTRRSADRAAGPKTAKPLQQDRPCDQKG